MKLLKKKGFSYVFVYMASLLITTSIITTGSFYYVKIQNNNATQSKIKNAYIKSELNNIVNYCTPTNPRVENLKYRKKLTANESLTVNLSCTLEPGLISFTSTICSVLNSNEEIKTCKIYNGIINN